jgi:hypothetical protein
MHELIVKLEELDSELAMAVRVIDHFDHLVAERASVPAHIRAAAALAGCSAGYRDSGRRMRYRYSPTGESLPPVGGEDWDRAQVPGHSGSFVWLERIESAQPMDALIVERLIHAIQALGSSGTQRDGEALLRTVCNPEAAPAERLAASQKLGLSRDVTVVVASAATSPLYVRLDGHTVSLLVDSTSIPRGCRAGTSLASDPLEIPDAVANAMVALRLADQVGGFGPSVVEFERLGSLAAVAKQFTREAAAVVEDVRRLDHALVSRPWVIDTLQVVLAEPSVRQAAKTLYVHHSTLQERLAWLGRNLGFGTSDPSGVQRLAVALLLWRIAHS